MKTSLITAAIATSALYIGLSLTGCAGADLSISRTNGKTSFALRPIIIFEK